MASNHTPGPWKLLEVGDHGQMCPATMENVSILTIAEEDGVPFAAVHDIADARLIAAAPDLLEALKDALELLERHYPRPAKNGQIARARAAIAKAEEA